MKRKKRETPDGFPLMNQGSKSSDTAVRTLDGLMPSPRFLSFPNSRK